MGVTYSDVPDLLVGTDLPLPGQPEKFIQDATDEIDSRLGMRYVTPIQVPDAPDTRATALLLKRLCNWLASGRLIMAQTSGSEHQNVHAYGAQLVKEASAVLDRIVTGEFILPGASTLQPDDLGRSGPIINNLDPGSSVEEFYKMVTTQPYPPYPPNQYPPIWPFGSPTQMGPYTW